MNLVAYPAASTSDPTRDQPRCRAVYCLEATTRSESSSTRTYSRRHDCDALAGFGECYQGMRLATLEHDTRLKVGDSARRIEELTRSKVPA